MLFICMKSSKLVYVCETPLQLSHQRNKEMLSISRSKTRRAVNKWAYC